jgi:hypothetical protein
MQRIALPTPVADLYRAIERLQATYGRKFTLDGHVLGSIQAARRGGAYSLRDHSIGMAPAAKTRNDSA